MASVSTRSCLYVRSSPTLVVLATCGLLSISMATATAVQQSDQSSEKEVTALKHLMQGIEMMVTIAPGFADVQIEPQFTFEESAVCFAYDLYTHVLTMEAELCSCDPDYYKVAAIKYMTDQIVKDACYWMMHDHNILNSAITTCSMKDVRDLCLHHKLQQSAPNVHRLESHAGALGDPRSFLSEGKLPQWLAATTQPQFGEPPHPVFQALLQMSGCTYGPNGFCSLPPATVYCTN